MRRLVGGVLALAAAGAVFWLWPRAPKDPEAQIRRLVAEALDSPTVEAEPVFARLEAKYAALAAERARSWGAKREKAKPVAKRRRRP